MWWRSSSADTTTMSRRVVDVFTVNDDGKVISLRVYKGELLDDDPPYDEDPPFPP